MKNGLKYYTNAMPEISSDHAVCFYENYLADKDE
jgi:hypothetical protein